MCSLSIQFIFCCGKYRNRTDDLLTASDFKIHKNTKHRIFNIIEHKKGTPIF
jgi:hypothetical protein